MELIATTNTRKNWMDEITDYMQDKKLPEDLQLANKLVPKASRHTIIHIKYIIAHTLDPTRYTSPQKWVCRS